MAVLPFAWPPYLAGLMIALVAMAAVRKDIEERGAWLLVLVRGTAIGVAVVALVTLADDGVTMETAIAVKVGTVVALLVPWRATEQAIAATASVVAASIVAFTFAIANARLTVWGAWVGVAAASAMLVGCVWWWIELRIAARRVRLS